MRSALCVLTAAALATAVSGCAVMGERPSPPATASQPPSPSPSSSPAAEQKVVRVIVPKPVKCVPDDLGPPPIYPDNDKALLQAGGAADRYQLMAAGRILRQQRLQKLEDAIRRCRNLGR